MTRTEVQSRIRLLKDELESRYKSGIVKMADDNGKAMPIITLQNEMFSLIYKLSRMD